MKRAILVLLIAVAFIAASIGLSLLASWLDSFFAGKVSMLVLMLAIAVMAAIQATKR